jgi:serine phosphatase RsbU (regulator of sigma subunit)/CHASE3 domain sensor protein
LSEHTLPPTSTIDPAMGGDPVVPLGARERLARVAREERLVVVALVAVTLLIATTIVAGLWISRELKHGADTGYVDQALPLRDATSDLSLQMVNQETAVRGFAITGDETTLAPYETGRRAVEADLAAIARHAAADPPIAPLLDDAKRRIAPLEQFFASQISLIRSGEAGKRQAQSQVEQGRLQFDVFRQSAAALRDEADRFATRTREAQDNRYRELVLALAGLGIVAVALSGFLAVVTPRRIGRLLRAIEAERTVSETAEAGAQRALAAAEQAEQRLELVADASAVLSRSLDLEETLTQIAQLCVASLCDYCVVDVGTPHTPLREIVVAHREPDKEYLVRELRSRWPAEDNPAYPTHVVQRTRRPVVHDHIDAGMLHSAALDADHLAVLEALAPTTDVVLPLIAGATVLGTLSLVTTAGSGRQLSAENLPLLNELAGRAAAAVRNAELFHSERRIASTLQASLLPPALPAIRGAEIAVAYVPGSEGLAIAGDFYDVFGIGDDRFALVIGDVCGKGEQAAALTGLARHTLRAAARMEPRSPRSALRMLNEALLAEREEHAFCTAAMGFGERTPTGLRLDLVCGGHPLPLCIRVDGTVEEVGAYGSLLGVLEDPKLEEREVVLAHGETLLFFTDGVVERHGGDAPFGETGLAAMLAGLTDGDARSLVDAVARAASSNRRTVDDIAMLAVRAVGNAV